MPPTRQWRGAGHLKLQTSSENTNKQLFVKCFAELAVSQWMKYALTYSTMSVATYVGEWKVVLFPEAMLFSVPAVCRDIRQITKKRTTNLQLLKTASMTKYWKRKSYRLLFNSNPYSSNSVTVVLRAIKTELQTLVKYNSGYVIFIQHQFMNLHIQSWKRVEN